MRAYVLITGTAFALLVLAHLARVVAEGPGPLTDPLFVATTLMAFALAVWAARLLFAARREDRRE